MNLKNNNGYTGVDISIAMIFILILVPTIFGIIYSIQKTNAEVERKSEAISIATDILETAKSLEYSEVSLDEGKQLVLELNNKYTNVNPNYEYSKTGNKNVYYKIEIEIENYYPQNTTEIEDLVKKLKVTVTYPIGNITKSIDISSLFKNM